MTAGETGANRGLTGDRGFDSVVPWTGAVVKGMEISIQIGVRLEAGGPERIEEVARLERGPLRPGTLGLSLAEARSILAGLERTLVEQQTAELIAQEQRCPRCGRPRPCKGHHRIVLRTPFGKLSLASPRLYRCRCELSGRKSFSPLAEVLPERTSPELRYLETKFAALVSYGLTLKLLEEVLPIGQDLSARTLRRQVHQAAERLEAELGDELKPAFEAVPPGQGPLTEPAATAGGRLGRRLRSRHRSAFPDRRVV